MNPWTDEEMAAQLAGRLDDPDQFVSGEEGEFERLWELYSELDAELPELDPLFARQLGATLAGSSLTESGTPNRQYWPGTHPLWQRTVAWLNKFGNARRVVALRPAFSWAVLLLLLSWLALSQIAGPQPVVERDAATLMSGNPNIRSEERLALSLVAEQNPLEYRINGFNSYLARTNSAGEIISPDTVDDFAFFNEIVNDELINGRLLVREGRFVLGVSDVRQRQLDVENIVMGFGGYMSQLNADLSNRGLPQAYMILHVPTDSFAAAMNEIRALGDEVVGETVTTFDITEQYIDLEARLRNLELVESEIAELLSDAREQGENADTIVVIYNDLVQQRTQIEQLQNEMQAVRQQATLAVIQVQLVGAEQIELPKAPPFWGRVVFADAWVSLLSLLQRWAVVLIWMAVYAPLVLVPAGLFTLLRRRRRK